MVLKKKMLFFFENGAFCITSRDLKGYCSFFNAIPKILGNSINKKPSLGAIEPDKFF